MAHEAFCDGLRARGFKYGPTTDEKLRTHNALVPYAELPENLKEHNRLKVRDIPTKLAMVGYIMIPARSNVLRFSKSETNRGSKLRHTPMASTVRRPASAIACADGAVPPASCV